MVRPILRSQILMLASSSNLRNPANASRHTAAKQTLSNNFMVEVDVPMDGRRLLVLLQLVEFLVTMLDVTLLISLLIIFHTVEYVE